MVWIIEYDDDDDDDESQRVITWNWIAQRIINDISKTRALIKCGCSCEGEINDLYRYFVSIIFIIPSQLNKNSSIWNFLVYLF